MESNKETEKEDYLNRFGHTITLINSYQAVLFGGAKTIEDLYNDSIIYEINEKKWSKLNGKLINKNSKWKYPKSKSSSCCLLYMSR